MPCTCAIKLFPLGTCVDLCNWSSAIIPVALTIIGLAIYIYIKSKTQRKISRY